MLLSPGPVDEIAREARMPSKANIPINGEGAQSDRGRYRVFTVGHGE